MDIDADTDLEFAIVPIAPYGMPLKYHSTISNGAIYVLVVFATTMMGPRN